ncbi:hypothetical protein L228DRAFT_251037 [Xylona heveae TC161]|uniref:F-box domain-containing protein n=1 Tax=Xylona heveae (strain CBS 132557 / TC161) TaxID=1328760 RepID=A0A164ZRZ4_XYLHT|nr:hypothetical protein L228DRAFT_251037 [Xylona heveae TC161]KZF19438.1 hypothetical protein L228DRAFT_251037 [Xylona heveae TC161]
MLSELPPEVLIEIFGCLEGFEDLFNFSHCSRYLYSIWMLNAESICHAMLPQAIMCFPEAEQLMEALEETESKLYPQRPQNNESPGEESSTPGSVERDGSDDNSLRAYPPVAYMQPFSYTDDPEIAYQHLSKARQRLYYPNTRSRNSAIIKLLHGNINLSPRTRRYLANADIVEASWDCFVDFTLPNLLNNPQNKALRMHVCGKEMTPSERLRFTRTHYRVWTCIVLGGTEELRAKRRAFLSAIGDRREINQMREVCLWLRHHCALNSKKLGLSAAAKDGRWQGAMNTIEDRCDAMGGMLPAIHTRGPFGFWTLLDHWQNDRMFDLWRG